MNAARVPNPLTSPISPITPRRRGARASPRRTKSDLRTLASPCDSPRRRSRSNDEKRPTSGIGKVAKRPAMSSPRTILRKSLQGERSGISWRIVFDTPFSHGNERMNIVTGVETMEDDPTTMELVTGQALHTPIDSTKDLLKQEDVKKVPERTKTANNKSPLKRRSSGEKGTTSKGEAGGIAERRRGSGEKSDIINTMDKAAPRRTSGEKSDIVNTMDKAAPRRTSGEKNHPNIASHEGTAPRRTSGEKSHANHTHNEGSALRRTSGEKSHPNNSSHEGTVPRRISSEKSHPANNEGTAPRRISGEKSNAAAPRRTSGDKSRDNGAAPRRVSGEKGHTHNSKSDVAATRRISGERVHQDTKHDEVAPRRVSGEKNKDQHVKQVKKGPHDLANRYFTRSSSDSERSADDDKSNNDFQRSNAVFGSNDDFSIDPLANFLPRAIDDSIHRRTLASNQLSFAESQVSEDSGLEVRPARRGRRHSPKKAPAPSKVQKGKAIHNRSKGSHLAKSATADSSPLDYGASRKSLSSASDNSSYDTNAVSATFMQFTLTEKGFVQALSKDHDVESESTMRLAKAVAESSVPHLPMYQQEEDVVTASDNLEPGVGECEGDDIDRNRQARQEHGIKSRFNQIGRKLRDVQRSLSGDGLEVMKPETKKKRNFLKAAHASFMRSSTSDDGIFGFRDDLSSENNADDVMQEE